VEQHELLGKNIEDVQKQNQVSILQILRQHPGQLSRKQVSGLVGLTPGTVTNIVRDLIEAGYVIETGYMAGKKGRRAVRLDLNPEGFYVLGVRLSRASIVCRAFNPIGEALLTKTAPIEDFEQSNEVLQCMLGLMQETVEAIQGDQKLQAIGVSTPGPLNLKEGKIAYLHGNARWRDVPIQQIVYERFGVATIMEHDANAAALGEFMFGAGCERKDLLYVAVGRGIGAGIVLNGKIHHGSLGTAGLLGHVSVDLNGPKCDCGGTGCLTNYSSSKAFIKRMEALGLGTGKISEFVKMADDGNEIVRREVRSSAQNVGVAVASAVNLLNPSVVVFGDEMTEFGSHWFDPLQETLVSRLAPEISKNLDVRLSSFGQESFLLGTGAIAIEHAFQNPSMKGN
jgi:N-acetylglucosamine repressor